ncbi:MAG: hypothetical protein ACK5QW_00505, partial [Cyanobacteriota bacterium]
MTRQSCRASRLTLGFTFGLTLPFAPPPSRAAAHAPISPVTAQPPTPSLRRPSARNPATTTLTPTSTLPTPAPSPSPAPNSLQATRERFHPGLSSGGSGAAPAG